MAYLILRISRWLCIAVTIWSLFQLASAEKARKACYPTNEPARAESTATKQGAISWQHHRQQHYHS